MKVHNLMIKFLLVAMVVAAIAAIGAHRASGQTGVLTLDSNVIIGIVPGQTLRLSVVNPQASGSEPVSAHILVYDSTGRLLAQTAPATIAHGQFHSFDIQREALAAAGEAGTGRLQVRGGIRIAVSDLEGGKLPAGFPFSLEVIDTATGSSRGDYFTGSVTVSSDGF